MKLTENFTGHLRTEHKASRAWRDLKQACRGENEKISTNKLEGECSRYSVFMVIVVLL